MELKVYPDKWPANTAPTIAQNYKVPTLKLGSWNVRTMTTGISPDIHKVSDIRKTAAINKELRRLQVDIAALQETRLLDSGSLKESDYTFFWQGKSATETREYGAGFAVRNTLLDTVELGNVSSERFLSMRLNTSNGPANLLCV
jgi:exonuclease III